MTAPKPFTAALLTLGFLVLAPGAAHASVAYGTVQDSNGERAQSGSVELYADPSGSGAESGEFKRVAQSTIRGGRFTIGASDAALAAHPAGATGYRDWLVGVRTKRGTRTWAFSARDGAPKQLRLRTQPAKGTPSDLSASRPGSCHYDVKKKTYRRVTMSELHSWTGVSATFRYAEGRAASTYLEAAIKSPKGVWSASGGNEVTRAKEFGQSVKIRGRKSRRVTGVFRFNILGVHGYRCPPDVIKGFTKAVRFEGGMRVEKSRPPAPWLSGRCKTANGHRKLYRGATVETSNTKSLTNSSAYSIFTVTLGSRTTFSENASITLENYGGRPAWVCGVSTSGGAVPIADAAMLFAGPRTRR
jgi:hypothetical protein